MKLSDILRSCTICNATGIRPGYAEQGEVCRACGGAGHHLKASAHEIAELLKKELVH